MRHNSLGDNTAKTIIDSCATTLYIGEHMLENMGVKPMAIKPRRVRVANKEIVTTTGIVEFEMKLGNLPAETITAYTFPLGNIDLVLGLPWLQKHNPHVDFRNLSYEFTRNGRRYHLYPPRAPPKLRMASAEEFHAFCDEKTDLFVITPEAPEGLPAEGRELRRRRRELQRWLK